MEGPGWAALILLIWVVLMIVGVISGWDLDAGNAFIAAAVLIGTVWATWAAFGWSRDLLRHRSTRAQRKLARAATERLAEEIHRANRARIEALPWLDGREVLGKDVVRRAPLTPGYDEAPDEAERSD